MRRIFFLLVVCLSFSIAGTALAQQSPVTPQAPRPDGSIVHVVQFGETLEGILAAYANYGVTLDNVLVYNNWRFRPQYIFVGDEIVVLPPGAVDPATGALVPGFSPAAAATAIPPTTAATAVPVQPTLAPTTAPTQNLPSEPSAPAFQAIQPFLPVGIASAEVALASTPEAESPTLEPQVPALATEEALEITPTITPELPTLTPTLEVVEQTTEEVIESTATSESPTEVVEVAPVVTEESIEPTATHTPESPTNTSEPTVLATEAIVENTPTQTPKPIDLASVPDFTAETGLICVRFFEDANQNGRFENSEALLTGGTIRIADTEESSTEDVLCVDDIPPGEMLIEATAPDSYGLTTSPSLKVQVIAGQTSEVIFGAVAGYQPPDTPVPAAETLTAPLPDTLQAVQTEAEDSFRLRDYSAFLVLAVALGLLIGGGAIIAALRSFR